MIRRSDCAARCAPTPLLRARRGNRRKRLRVRRLPQRVRGATSAQRGQEVRSRSGTRCSRRPPSRIRLYHAARNGAHGPGTHIGAKRADRDVLRCLCPGKVSCYENRARVKHYTTRPPPFVACAALIAALTGSAAEGAAQEIRSAEAPATSSATVQERAKAQFDEGTAHYERGEFRAAAASFGTAYELFPEPAFLYNLAQAERLDGQCESALAHYEEFSKRFKGTTPSDVEQKMADMKRCVAAARPGQSVE